MQLYRLEREGNVDELAEVLRHSDSDSVRRRAAEIIGDLAADRDPDLDEHVVEVLVTASASDDDESVRAAAIEALDRYGPPALERLVTEVTDHTTGPAQAPGSKRAFLDVVDAEEPELRMAAVTGLGHVGDPSVTPKLVERLDDEAPRVRRRAATACGRIGDPSAVPALRARFGDTDAAVRRTAGEALAEIGGNDALSALRQFATAEHPSLRRNAVDALGRFGGLEAVDVLADALEDDVRRVRRTAMYSLVECVTDAVPHLSHDVRSAVIERLRSAPAGDVVPVLTEILSEGTGVPQRRNAAWLLGRVAADEYRPRALDALFETVLDAPSTTARVAAASLVELEASELESRLLAVVDDESKPTETRSVVVFVLARVGDASTRTALESVYERTTDERVRDRIVAALTKLRGTNPAHDDGTDSVIDDE